MTEKPYVGMPVTYTIGSDRYAAAIVNISKNLKRILITFVDGNEMLNGTKKQNTFTLRKCGSYVNSGKKCGYLLLGFSQTKLDEGF